MRSFLLTRLSGCFLFESMVDSPLEIQFRPLRNKYPSGDRFSSHDQARRAPTATHELSRISHEFCGNSRKYGQNAPFQFQTHSP
jgi:hypothetical protein